VRARAVSRLLPGCADLLLIRPIKRRALAAWSGLPEYPSTASAGKCSSHSSRTLRRPLAAEHHTGKSMSLHLTSRLAVLRECLLPS
jgi:hypothetical protein